MKSIFSLPTIGCVAALTLLATQVNAQTIERDIEYASAEPASSKGHLLDLYLPAARKPAPVVVWLRGSGWMAEAGRDGAQIWAPHLNARGYAVVGVATHSSGNAKFPAQVHDVKAAIRWLRAHAKQYHLDARRIAVMGDSSGGWTALMAGFTGDVPALAGNVGVTGPSSAVQAVVAFYPPTDLLQMDAHMLQPCGPDHPGGLFNQVMCHGGAKSPESLLLGCELRNCAERARAANPITYIGRHEPPVLVLHGQADPLVPYHQSELLYAALRAQCNDVTFITYPLAQHGVWQKMLEDAATMDNATIQVSKNCKDVAPMPIQPSWELLLGFLDKHLKK